MSSVLSDLNSVLYSFSTNLNVESMLKLILLGETKKTPSKPLVCWVSFSRPPLGCRLDLRPVSFLFFSCSSFGMEFTDSSLFLLLVLSVGVWLCWSVLALCSIARCWAVVGHKSWRLDETRRRTDGIERERERETVKQSGKLDATNLDGKKGNGQQQQQQQGKRSGQKKIVNSLAAAATFVYDRLNQGTFFFLLFARVSIRDHTEPASSA